jgi:hypothetical protein
MAHLLKRILTEKRPLMADEDLKYTEMTLQYAYADLLVGPTNVKESCLNF